VGNADEATAYCTSCGLAISGSAKFCRACGAAQAPSASGTPAAQDEAATLVAPVTAPAPAPPRQTLPPLSPPPPPSPLPPLPPLTATPARSGASAATILAIAGGAGMILMVAYAIVYYPLHYDYPVNFGEPLQFGDLLAAISGAAAIAIGAAAMRRSPGNPVLNGVLLVAAGAPTLVLTVLWAFPDTFHLSTYPPPFYAGFVYFGEFGQAHIGSGYLQIPLAISAAAVALAGVLIGSPGEAARQPGRR
jgi:hypothetical protein